MRELRELREAGRTMRHQLVHQVRETT
jgi:hypothetical protein